MNRTAGLTFVVTGVVVVALGVVGLVASDGGGRVAAGPTGSATDDGGATGPEGTGPTTGATGVIAPQVETPEEFLPEFSRAIREGDARFLLARLHPVVIGFYGERECRAVTRRFVDPSADLRFVSSSDPGEYLWEVDGSSTPVPDVLTVEVIQPMDGQDTELTIHLGIVGTELRWFTDCGDPA